MRRLPIPISELAEAGAMKRDWELVRKILTQIEELDSSERSLKPSALEGYTSGVVSYHMSLLKDAGLIEATCSQPLSGQLQCIATSLTWDGHEFLDKIRSDTTWGKIKSLAKTKGLDLSIEVIKNAATTVIGNAFQ